jgi:hypothetical protein
MSTSQSHHQPSKIPSQIRELRMEPDPEEPAYSFEDDKQLGGYNHLLQKEDDFHRLLMQTNHRIRGSSTTTATATATVISNHNNNYSNSNQEGKSMDCKPTLRSSVVNFQNGNSAPDVISVCFKLIDC